MSITRWDPFRNVDTLQEQVNRLFENSFQGNRTDGSALTTWAPAVDIYRSRRAEVRAEGEGRKLPADRAHVRIVQPQLRFAKYGEYGSDQGRVQERRLDRGVAETGRIEAESGEGQRDQRKREQQLKPISSCAANGGREFFRPLCVSESEKIHLWHPDSTN